MASGTKDIVLLGVASALGLYAYTQANNPATKIGQWWAGLNAPATPAKPTPQIINVGGSSTPVGVSASASKGPGNPNVHAKGTLPPTTAISNYGQHGYADQSGNFWDTSSTYTVYVVPPQTDPSGYFVIGPQ